MRLLMTRAELAKLERAPTAGVDSLEIAREGGKVYAVITHDHWQQFIEIEITEEPHR